MEPNSLGRISASAWHQAFAVARHGECLLEAATRLGSAAEAIRLGTWHNRRNRLHVDIKHQWDAPKQVCADHV